MSDIIGNIQSNAVATKNVGFFGIFSGEMKKRILLGGDNDKSNQLAIACFKENEYPDGENTKWVKVQFKGKFEENSTIKLDIRSIEVRLGISRDEILDLKSKGQLEEVINTKAQNYQKDLKAVNDFRKAVITFLSSNGDDAAVNNFKAALDQFKPRGTLNNQSKKMEVGIQNEDIKELCLECIRDFNNVFSFVSEYKSNNVLNKPAKYDEIITVTYKNNFEKILRRFDKEIFGIDRNFSLKSAKNNVIRTLWGDTDLVLSEAESMGFKSSGKLAIRLHLIPGNSKFSVLTNGKIYHQKPKATTDYIPYSKDGKTWVLLSAKSLSSRFHLNRKAIKEIAKNPSELEKIISKHKNLNEDILHLVNSLRQASKEGKRLEGLYSRFMGKLDDKSLGKEIKEIINNSDSEAEAIARIEYRYTDSTSGSMIKITQKNVAEFANEGLLIDDTSQTDIPLKIKLDENFVVETNGFVYMEQPTPTKEYVTHQLKGGYWTLLNVKSINDNLRLRFMEGFSKKLIDILSKLVEFSDPTLGKQITKISVIKFANDGLFIDDTFNTSILKIKLGGDNHKIDVKTNGFVYEQEPSFTEGYLAFQFKKGCWVLLNKDSLVSSGVNIDEIKQILTDHEQFNKYINISKKHDDENLRQLDKAPSEINQDFSVKLTESNRVLWDDMDAQLTAAKPMEFESGERARRLVLIPSHNHEYSVLMKDETYSKKPMPVEGYVPFSKDGETWVLLSVKSLASRFSLKPKDIEEAATKEGGVKKLIDKRTEVNEKIRGLIESYKTPIINREELALLYQTFIENLNKSDPYYDYMSKIANEIKDIFETSDTTAQAMDRFYYIHMDSIGLLVKISKENIAEFANEGFFIDLNSSKLDIPIKIKLGGDIREVIVETTGFAYKRKPVQFDSKEYLPFQFKEGTWILLSIKSLLNSAIELDEIKHALDDPKKLKDLINNLKK